MATQKNRPNKKMKTTKNGKEIVQEPQARDVKNLQEEVKQRKAMPNRIRILSQEKFKCQ